MQFTILGTTISIVRKPREQEQLLDHLVVGVRSTNDLLEAARREELIIHAKASRQNIF